ncbi:MULTISPECIES: hypothetical protein [unclassified Streptomyces]
MANTTAEQAKVTVAEALPDVTQKTIPVRRPSTPRKKNAVEFLRDSFM